uniref:Uncharacterized protein n=1 Tax=Bactrocera dorsalis TaxID=27457 RepID=A0A034UZR1_BACDO
MHICTTTYMYVSVCVHLHYVMLFYLQLFRCASLQLRMATQAINARILGFAIIVDNRRALRCCFCYADERNFLPFALRCVLLLFVTLNQRGVGQPKWTAGHL